MDSRGSIPSKDKAFLFTKNVQDVWSPHKRACCYQRVIPKRNSERPLHMYKYI
jgi:hypothetical protein